jgi:hypothetical protein
MDNGLVAHHGESLPVDMDCMTVVELGKDGQRTDDLLYYHSEQVQDERLT